MRTRTRTVNEVYPACTHEYHRYSVPPVTTPINLNYNARTVVWLIESMTDELAAGKRSGSCTHTKVEFKIWAGQLSYKYPHSGIEKVQPPSWPIYTHVYLGTSLFEQFAGSLYNTANGAPTITVPSNWDWKTLSYHAVAQMRPTLNKEGLLLNNFVSEIAKGCKTSHNRWANQTQTDRTLPKGWGGRVMGLLRRVAGFNLLYQFTIRPTISDVQTILSRIRDLEKHLAKLIEEGDRIQTRHCKVPLVDRISLPSDYVYQDIALGTDYPGWRTTVETRWSTRPTYHATLRFKYDTSQLKTLIGSLRAHLDAYGISRVFSSLWEAIPYSFVVDWFVNIGGWIRSIEDSLAGDLMPMQILTFDHSIKYEYKTGCYHDIGKAPWKIISRILLYERTTTYYVRRAEAPSLYDSLSVRLPSLNQALLGGSLVVARK